METTILVIDSSRAVQALAASALQKHGYRIEVLGDGGKALETIRLLQPTIVIFGNDVDGIDSPELCRAIRSDAEVSETFIVVLVSGHSDGSQFSKELQDSGADRVLKKPFKSVELTEAVSSLLSAPREREEENRSPLAFLGGDTLLIDMLQKLFEKQNQNIEVFSDQMQLMRYSQETPLAACIIQRELAADLSWHQDEEMGRLIVVVPEDGDISELLLPPNARVLRRPLSVSKLEESLGMRFSNSAGHIVGDSVPPLSQSGRSELAANISAGVYRLLLQHEGLQRREWNDVSADVAEEVLQICKRAPQ